MLTDQEARVRGAGVVTTGAGAVGAGAEVAGGDATGVDGAAGAAETGADADPPFEPFEAVPDEAGANPAAVVDGAEPVDELVLTVAGDAAAGGAPATGTAAGSTAVLASNEFGAPVAPDAPATFNSTVAGAAEPLCCPLKASAATIAVVAAKLSPAVRARDAGAFVPFFLAGDFGECACVPLDADAARAAAGMRSVIVTLLFVVIVAFTFTFTL